MITEAEKYLGLSLCVGGSSPSTSFDCSGFISWVINHSGWDVGRLDRQRPFEHLHPCFPRERPARRPDLFQGTYDTAGASHVGLYVGDGMMIHCGSPISYANINTFLLAAAFLHLCETAVKERSFCMNAKIKKINAEYEKNAAKIADLQARQKELDKQRTELENLDIAGMVRSMGMTPEELAAPDRSVQKRPDGPCHDGEGGNQR